MTSAPTRVLVVEDEAAAARVLMDEVGAAAGFVVAGHTCSGATALRRVVSDDEVDLVMLDIQLPTSPAWTSCDGCGRRAATST